MVKAVLPQLLLAGHKFAMQWDAGVALQPHDHDPFKRLLRGLLRFTAKGTLLLAAAVANALPAAWKARLRPRDGGGQKSGLLAKNDPVRHAAHIVQLSSFAGRVVTARIHYFMIRMTFGPAPDRLAIGLEIWRVEGPHLAF